MVVVVTVTVTVAVAVAVAVAMAMAMREVTLGAVLVMLAVVMEMASAAVPQATPALTTSLSLALKSWTNLLSLMNLKKSWHVLCLSVATPQSVNVLIDTRTSCHRHLRPSSRFAS